MRYLKSPIRSQQQPFQLIHPSILPSPQTKTNQNIVNIDMNPSRLNPTHDPNLNQNTHPPANSPHPKPNTISAAQHALERFHQQVGSSPISSPSSPISTPLSFSRPSSSGGGVCVWPQTFFRFRSQPTLHLLQELKLFSGVQS